MKQASFVYCLAIPRGAAGKIKSILQAQYNYTKRKCPSYPWICRCCNYVRKTALARRVKIESETTQNNGATVC